MMPNPEDGGEGVWPDDFFAPPVPPLAIRWLSYDYCIELDTRLARPAGHCGRYSELDRAPYEPDEMLPSPMSRPEEKGGEMPETAAKQDHDRPELPRLWAPRPPDPVSVWVVLDSTTPDSAA